MVERENQMNSELTSSQKELSSQLFEVGAIKFGDFKLKLHEENPEAPLSPIYIDLRILRRFPEAKESAVDVYEELLSGLEYDLLADIPTAATPFVASLSDRLGAGVISPRSDSKDYGSGAKIDGMLPSDKGKTAVLIDDLVTHADSKLESAEILRDGGVEVNDVVVLIDREQGGHEQLLEEGLTLRNALTIEPMLDYYLDSGKIDKNQYERVKSGLEKLNNYIENK